jgi:hypothetical protein
MVESCTWNHSGCGTDTIAERGAIGGAARSSPHARPPRTHNAEIRSRKRGRPLSALTCNTLDEFTSAVAERDATFRALVSNLEAKSVEPVHPPQRHRRVEIVAAP